MKISIIITIWSASSGLALPTIILKSTAPNSNEFDKEQSNKALGLSGAYLAGAGIAGGGLWIYHKATVKELREEQENAKKELRKQHEEQMRDHGARMAREARQATEDAYWRGRQEADPTEEKHQRLLRCYEEALPMYVNEFPYDSREEYEDLIWNLCSQMVNIDIQDPAFTWGPRKTGYDLMRPRGAGYLAPNQGSQQSRNQQPPSTPPRPLPPTEDGGPLISSLSYVKNGIMNKAKSFGQNLARIAGAVTKSTNNNQSTGGSTGGLKVPAAPAIRPPGGMAVPPL